MTKRKVDEHVSVISALLDPNHPVRDWEEVYNLNIGCETRVCFISCPPMTLGNNMPATVNRQSPSSGTNGEKALHNGLTEMIKRFHHTDATKHVVVTRYRWQQNVENQNGAPERCYFLVLVKAKKPTATRSLQKIQKLIPVVPVMGDIQFATLNPTVYAINPNKEEYLKITGANLRAVDGLLVPHTKDPTKIMKLQVAIGPGYFYVVALFVQVHGILNGSSYSVYLKIHDKFFEVTQFPVLFMDPDKMHIAVPLQLPEIVPGGRDILELEQFLMNSYPTSTSSLVSAVELGNTRHVALISTHCRGVLPALDDISMTWAELACKSGNLCTLFFVVVWERVSAGKCDIEKLEQLQQRVLNLETPVEFPDMVLSVEDINERSKTVLQLATEILEKANSSAV